MGLAVVKPDYIYAKCGSFIYKANKTAENRKSTTSVHIDGLIDKLNGYPQSAFAGEKRVFGPKKKEVLSFIVI